jgi:hypothetical protein
VSRSDARNNLTTDLVVLTVGSLFFFVVTTYKSLSSLVVRELGKQNRTDWLALTQKWRVIGERPASVGVIARLQEPRTYCAGVRGF